MQKKLLLTIPFLVILAVFPFVSAASTVNIHVDARYENASYTTTLPTSTPTPTATATAQPSPSPTANTASPNPSTSTTGNPTTGTGTASPNPDQTANPQVPELAPFAILLIAAALSLAAVAVRRGFKRPKRPALAAVAVILLSCLIPASLWAQAPAAAQATPNVQFSLYFTNGTAFPTGTVNAAGYQNGGMYLNVGGIQCTASSYGSQYVPLTNVVVVKNSGDVNITVNASIKNVNCPVNYSIQLSFFPLAPATYVPYSNNWLGNTSAVAKNPVPPGQYMYLGIQVTLSQPSNVPSGTPTSGFSYSFDIEVSAAGS